MNLTYKQQKELIELEFDRKITTLKYMRETERLKHEWELERGRIKSAEIRKMQMRKKEGAFKY